MQHICRGDVNDASFCIKLDAPPCYFICSAPPAAPHPSPAQISLVLVDEVHLLNEAERGSALEAGVVSRVMTIGRRPELKDVRREGGTLVQWRGAGGGEGARGRGSGRQPLGKEERALWGQVVGWWHLCVWGGGANDESERLGRYVQGPPHSHTLLCMELTCLGCIHASSSSTHTQAQAHATFRPAPHAP